jgi:hypothetical protein
MFGAFMRSVAIHSSNSHRIVDLTPHVRRKNSSPHRWWNCKNSSYCDMVLFEHKAAS